MVRRFLFALSAVVLVIGLVLPAAAQSGNAMVRVIHASPDAPAVDIFVGGQAVLANVSFPTASDYLQVPAGTLEVAIAPTGQGVGAAVITADVPVQAGQPYTIAAVGQLADDTLRAQVYNDNLAAPASGKAHVRVFHLSPDAPAVDVKLADGTALVAGLGFPNGSDYLPVDAGTYDLQVTPAGGDDIVLDLSGTQLQAGVIYDVLAVGTLDSIQAEVATFTPMATLPDTGLGTNIGVSAMMLTLGVLTLAGGMALRRHSAT